MHYRHKYTYLLIGLLALCFTAGAQEDTLTRSAEDTVAVVENGGLPLVPEFMPVRGPVVTRPFSDTLSAASIENISYQLYLNQEWPALQLFTNAAIAGGYDYFYMRMRAGIAGFELKQYRAATVHFEKALNFNSEDEYAKSSLYLCYLYTDRAEEARWLSRSFSPALQENMRVSGNPVYFLFMENGLKHADSSRLFKDAVFAAAGIQHALSPRLSLFHGLNFFKQGEARFNVQQFQYYLRGDVVFQHGIKLQAGLHLVKVDADIKSTVSSVTTTTYLPPPPASGQPPPTGFITTIDQHVELSNTQKNHLVGAITITKQNAQFSYFIGGTLSNLDTVLHYQVSAGAVYYPFKNNHLSLGLTAYAHSEAPYVPQYLALAPFVNAYLSKKVNIYAAYMHNSGTNIVENTGYFVSNSIDYTTGRETVTASFNVMSRTWLYATGGLEQKKQFTAGYHYNYILFLIGLKFVP